MRVLFKKYILSYVFACVIAFICVVGDANAQKEVGIAAIVDNSVISTIDLQARIKIAMFSASLPEKQGFEEKLLPQVLRGLVNERIYAKEAKELGIQVSDIEIKRVLADLEQKNNIAAGKFGEFLKNHGVSEAAMIDQIKSQLLWGKIVARNVRPKISVSDKEIDEAIERISKQSGVEEVNISEIVLNVDSPEDNRKVGSLARGLVSQLRKDGDFKKIAKQFSQASSAENGGDIGWISTGQLPNKILMATKNMSVGEVSNPIRVDDGYVIIRVNDRRALVQALNETGDIGIRRALVRVSQESSGETREKIALSISKAVKRVKKCSDFKKFAKDVGSVVEPQLINTKIENLTEDVRFHIKDLKEGQVSQVFPVEGGLNVIMVCKREQGEPEVALKNNIKDMIFRHKLEVQANRYLRDLRRGAFIEIRI